MYINDTLPERHCDRFQLKYATTDKVALDLELPTMPGGISMYDLLFAVRDGLMLPPEVGVQILSTAHSQRPLTIYDCMVFMDERPPAYVPKYRIRQKRSAGECRLREFFLPVDS